MSVAENIRKVLATIHTNVQLVAVSKTYPTDVLMEAYKEGQRAFGENRPQELLQKREQLPTDIDWHFIGHLQTNKVKSIVPFAHMIHAVDSERLYYEIGKETAKINRPVACLLQVHIANEETKFGFTPDELVSFLESIKNEPQPYAPICGLMGMATYTDDTEQVRREFRGLKQLFDQLKTHFFANKPQFKELSMGMSGDYAIAIEEGATIVRIGSLIFGERQYS